MMLKTLHYIIMYVETLKLKPNIYDMNINLKTRIWLGEILNGTLCSD